MATQITHTDSSVLVKIEKLVHGGKGLAHEGSMAVFVEGVLPGESARVQLGRQRKGYAEGRLRELVTPSPDRVPPPCPVYGTCGGCQLQHASASAQLELKRAILLETLARVGGLTDLSVPPLTASPEAYGYRSRARLAVSVPARGVPSLAYHEENSQRLVPIAACPLLAPRLNEAVAHLNRLLAGTRAMASLLSEVSLGLSVTTGELVLQYAAEHCTQRQAHAWFELVRTGLAGLKGQVLTAGRGPRHRRWMDGETTLSEQVGNLRLRCSDRSFVQANWKLNAALIDTITAWASEGEVGAGGASAGPPSAQTEAPGRVLELYAGIGNFGLPIARAGGLVTFVEGNPSALADARYNARVNHLGRCRFRLSSAEAFVANSDVGEYDAVVIDPPRTGLGKEVLAGLVRLKPHRILYLSCDPPTLARDLRAMHDAGYRVMRLQGFDMFPQTMHIETLVQLTPEQAQ